MPRMLHRIMLCLGVWLVASSLCAADAPSPVRLTVQLFDPVSQHSHAIAINQLCYRLMQEDPELEILPWNSLTLASGDQSAYFMAIAGDMAPDVTTELAFPHCRHWCREGFYLPLNEFIGEDKNGDGQISDEEAIWPEWKNLPAFFRRIATIDGKVYALPQANLGMGALLVRKDLLRKAGIDPETPPKDWESLYRILQKLTLPPSEESAGQCGLILDANGWTFAPWIWAAGGELLQQSRTNSRTGRTYWYPQEETAFRDPNTGESLLREPVGWRATFGGSEGQKALEFYRKMRFAPWIHDPVTHEPANLTEAEVEQGWMTRPDGSRFDFVPEDVQNGVARVILEVDSPVREELFRRGEAAMTFWVCIPEYFRTLGIPPENLGVWPIPPMHAGLKPAMIAQYHYMALNANLAGKANRARRQKAWKVLSTAVGQRGSRWAAELLCKEGLGQFLGPELLQRAGMTRELEQIPLSWRNAWKAGLTYARTEPFEGFWAPIAGKILRQDILSLALTQQDFDFRGALEKGQRQANDGLMFKRTDAQLARYRPWGWMALAALSLAMLGALVIRVGKLRAPPAEFPATPGAPRRWGLLLVPALMLLLMWQYYPMARGAAMAFQDYSITGRTRWVGIDNFLTVLLDGNFWIYLRQTLAFVAISLVLGFLTPVLLALLLSEVPRGKVFFRTLFFLPQVSSGLVIVFLWKVLIYDPTPNGLLNRIVPFGAVDWLSDPHWAMAAVILPGVWAGAGIGSLVYLAALQAIPQEVYEAADLDGCNVWQKIRHVTLPSLGPLLIINLIGTLMGTLHSMGHIFAMTGGGPGNQTMVLSLAIWYEAFAYLRFGSATAMAWMLGSLLVGLSLSYPRLLRPSEWRKAE